MDAPRRHHYIPQFMLRGFASRETSKETYVWMFRRGQIGGKEVNTINLAQERDFHGDPAISNLEVEIRQHESEFARLVTRLRSGVLSDSDIPVLRQLVVHQIIRTKNVRAGFASAAETLFGELGAALPRLNQRKLKHQTKKELKKELRDGGAGELLAAMPAARRKLAKQIMRKAIRETDLRPGISIVFREFLQNIDIKSIAAKGHIDALSRQAVPNGRLKGIEHLKWELMLREPRAWVLGDVAVLARFSAEEQLRSPINVTSKIELLIAPIAHNVCVVGRSSATVPIPEPREVNMASAHVSREFFVASCSADHHTKLQEQIGIRAELISQDEVTGIVNDVIK